MNLFEILDLCTPDMQVLVSAIKTVFTLIQVAIPGVLIVLGTIDMFKAMTSGDEKKTEAARKSFIKRLIYAVVAFLIPFIIRLVFNFVATNLNTGDPTAISAYDEFFACWDPSSSKSNTNTSSSCNCYYVENGQEKYYGVTSDEKSCASSHPGKSVSCK